MLGNIAKGWVVHNVRDIEKEVPNVRRYS
jgi:hypothetical protein